MTSSNKEEKQKNLKLEASKLYATTNQRITNWLPSINEHLAITNCDFPPPLAHPKQIQCSSPRRLSLPAISSFDIPKFSLDDDVHRKHSLQIPDYSRLVYECNEPECQIKFNTIEEFRSHLTLHTSKKILQCPFLGCNKTYVRPNKYAAHYRTHCSLNHNIQPALPNVASISNINKPNFFNHQKACLEPSPYNNISNETLRRFSTPTLYSNQSNYQQIRDTPSLSNNGQREYSRGRVASLDYGRPGPGRPTNQQRATAIKNSLVWEGVDESGNPIKYFLCQVEGCFMKFKRSEHLRRHQGVHTQERPFECPNPHCSKRFSRSDNLRQHLRIHQRAKNSQDNTVAFNINNFNNGKQ